MSPIASYRGRVVTDADVAFIRQLIWVLDGCLTFIEGEARAVEKDSLFLPGGGTTFHGRDRFAPVAAALANDFPFEDLGAPIKDRVRLDYTEPCYSGERVTGTIVAIDRFGNAITDVEAARIPFSRFQLRVGDATISRRSTTSSSWDRPSSETR